MSSASGIHEPLATRLRVDLWPIVWFVTLAGSVRDRGALSRESAGQLLFGQEPVGHVVSTFVAVTAVTVDLVRAAANLIVRGFSTHRCLGLRLPRCSSALPIR